MKKPRPRVLRRALQRRTGDRSSGGRPNVSVGETLPPCPFCGAAVAVDLANAGVIHGLPMCERFRRLSPVDFMTAMRVEREARLEREGN